VEGRPAGMPMARVTIRMTQGRGKKGPIFKSASTLSPPRVAEGKGEGVLLTYKCWTPGRIQTRSKKSICLPGDDSRKKGGRYWRRSLAKKKSVLVITRKKGKAIPGASQHRNRNQTKMTFGLWGPKGRLPPMRAWGSPRK